MRNTGGALIVALACAGWAGCGSPPPTMMTMPPCSDGIDNDHDLLVDTADPGCAFSHGTAESPDPPVPPACSNGLDDDGDHVIDFPTDPGCASATDDDEVDPIPACNDGLDNDGDHIVDFPTDPGCASATDDDESDPTACANGRDDDSDGHVDYPDDPGCTDGTDGDETDPPAACGNHLDDDGDGYVDYPDDPGCANAADMDETEPPECDNGVDDDGDGATDYPADTDCASATDATERPTLACSNGVDDDGDGLVDFGVDPGCASPDDADETDRTSVCGPLSVTDITATGDAMGSATAGAASSLESPTCHGRGGETVFRYSVGAGPHTALVVTTDHGETTLDTVVYVRSACRDPGTELGCDDDSGSDHRSSTLLLRDVAPGDYLVVVDTFGAGSLGDFRLTVTRHTADGAACDEAAPTCLPGNVCRPLRPGDPATCQPERCRNGVDDDGDGTIDYPAEPGCTHPLDDDEVDPVPAPLCANGADDDGDGYVDWPSDIGCAAAGDGEEADACYPGLSVQSLDVLAGAVGVTSGTSSAGGTCSSPSTSSPEAVYGIGPSGYQTLTLTAVSDGGWDTVLHVREGACDTGAEVACNDNVSPGLYGTSRVTFSPTDGEHYFAFVDGNWGAAGGFALTVTGTRRHGATCDAASAAFPCVVGDACRESSPGAGDFTCRVAACSNATDDDGDGRIDAADPGCTTASDDDETPDPSPPPACANGVDDDGDGAIDYPADVGCVRASSNDEIGCMDSDTVVDVTHSGGTYSGTTVGATQDVTPFCVSQRSGDVVHFLRVPGTTRLHLDMCGATFDTVMYVVDTCGSTATLACGDDSSTCGYATVLDLTVSAGRHFIYVAGYGSGSGPYTLHIGGSVLAGEPCDPMQSSFLPCEAGSCVDLGSGYRCQ